MAEDRTIAGGDDQGCDPLDGVVPARKKRPPRKSKVTLTAEHARQAFSLWRLAGPCGAITDEQVADILGVTFGQLRGWLQRNTRPVDPKTGQEGPRGLRDIRARARAEHRAYYLGMVHRSIEVALANADPHGIRMGAIWMLEKLNLDMFAKAEEDAEQGGNKTGVLVTPGPDGLDEWRNGCEQILEGDRDGAPPALPGK